VFDLKTSRFLIGLCCVPLIGCGQAERTAMVDRVAEQAARIATLEVQAQSAASALASQEKQLDEATAAVAVSEKARQEAQAERDRLAADIKSVSEQNETLAARVQELISKLADDSRKLADLEDEELIRKQRDAVIGPWQAANGYEAVFREDGTGVLNRGVDVEAIQKRMLRMRNNAGTLGSSNNGDWEVQDKTEEPPADTLDYRFNFASTRTPGVFQLFGRWRKSGAEAGGTFRLLSDGEAVLEGMDAVERPRSYSKKVSAITK
jgi:hypothetical protein